MTLRIVKMAGDRPMAPRHSAFTEKFWDALREGRFLVSHCGACEHLTFPPKRHCPQCRHRSIDWQELSGAGRLYSLTRVHAGPPRFADDMPYAVAIIDLDEGVRLVTRMHGDVGFEDLDKPVELLALIYDDGPSFAASIKASRDV